MIYKDCDDSEDKKQQLQQIQATENREHENIPENLQDYNKIYEYSIQNLSNPVISVVNEIVSTHITLISNQKSFNPQILFDNEIFQNILTCKCDRSLYYQFMRLLVSTNRDNAFLALIQGLFAQIVLSGDLSSCGNEVRDLVQEYMKYGSVVMNAAIYSSEIIQSIIKNFDSIDDEFKHIYANIVATIVVNSPIKKLFEPQKNQFFTENEARPFLMLENKPFNEQMFIYFQEHGIPVLEEDSSDIAGFFLQYIRTPDSLLALQHIVSEKTIEWKYILFNQSFKEIFFDIDSLMKQPIEYHRLLVKLLDNLFFRLEYNIDRDYTTNIMNYLLIMISDRENFADFFNNASTTIINLIVATNYPEYLQDLFSDEIVSIICSWFAESNYNNRKAALFLFLRVAAEYKVEIVDENALEAVVDFLESDFHDMNAIDIIVDDLSTIFRKNEELVEIFRELGGAKRIEEIIDDENASDEVIMFYNDFFDDTEIVFDLE